MKVINLPFLEEFEGAMLSGSKTCTARTKQYGQPGDTFNTFGRQFEIEYMARMYLEDVAKLCFKEEGFKKPKDFIDCWIKLHPRRGFVKRQIVWVHHFKKMRQKVYGISETH